MSAFQQVVVSEVATIWGLFVARIVVCQAC